MQVLDWNDFDAQVKMALQGGSTPDVLQTVGYVHKVADDLFQRAEEVLFPAAPDRFVDAFAQAGGMDGARYGIRCVSSTRVLIPNEKLRRRRRRRAGEELGRHQIGCGARLEEGPRRGLVRAAARSRGDAVRMPRLGELGNRGGYTDANGKRALDCDANIETFEWPRTDLVEPGRTYGSSAATDRKRHMVSGLAAGSVGQLLPTQLHLVPRKNAPLCQPPGPPAPRPRSPPSPPFGVRPSCRRCRAIRRPARRGERVAVVGCGASWFMAQSYAVLRETCGHGETDAYAASGFPSAWTHVERARAHHRDEIRRLKTAVFVHLDHPHARQALQVVRWRRDLGMGKPTIEPIHLVRSPPPGAVSGSALAAWIRGRRRTDNQSHHVRDRTFHEDASHIRPVTCPASWPACATWPSVLTTPPETTSGLSRPSD